LQHVANADFFILQFSKVVFQKHYLNLPKLPLFIRVCLLYHGLPATGTHAISFSHSLWHVSIIVFRASGGGSFEM